MKAIVTGGAGFIGSHVSERLAEEGWDVSIIDNLSTGSAENLDRLSAYPRFNFLGADMLDPGILESALTGADLIVHLGALVSVQESLADPRKSFRNNAEAISTVLEAARRTPTVGGLIYASSAAVYGNQATLPIGESSTPTPLSPYAVDKVYGELLADVFWRAYRVRSIGLRFFNAYGPRQVPSSPYSGVICKFMDAAMRGRNPVIFGDGAQTRDFVFVLDIVEMVMRCIRRLLEENSGVESLHLNAGSGQATSVTELWNQISQLCGTRLEPHHEGANPGEIRHSCADMAATEAVLGWRPPTPLVDGLKLTLGHFEGARLSRGPGFDAA